MNKPKPLMPVEAIVRVYHPREGIYYYEVVRSAPKTVWLRQVTTVEAFVLRTFDFARIPVQGGFVNDTIIPCRLHKDGGLYVRGHQVHRYHGEVHDPRYDRQLTPNERKPQWPPQHPPPQSCPSAPSSEQATSTTRSSAQQPRQSGLRNFKQKRGEILEATGSLFPSEGSARAMRS